MIQHTEQYLDAIVARHGASWSADYRKRFIAMTDEVAAHKPERLASTPKLTNRPESAKTFASIREKYGV